MERAEIERLIREEGLKMRIKIMNKVIKEFKKIEKEANSD